ncbi:MAG: ATP-binding cassette domain-containing protein, partial [bacterium]
MIQVDDLSVRLGGKVILKHVHLHIPAGETHVLFGPNGSGKTTLLMAIMGFPEYEIISGRIMFQGEEITQLSIDERARRGIGLSFQRPPTIKGLKTRHVLEICNRSHRDLGPLIEKFNFQDFLSRDINQGFSGGEIKKSELLQLLSQGPELILLDEPESGVDLESIATIGNIINQLLEKEWQLEAVKSKKEMRQERHVAGLIITHTGY